MTLSCKWSKLTQLGQYRPFYNTKLNLGAFYMYFCRLFVIYCPAKLAQLVLHLKGDL